MTSVVLATGLTALCGCGSLNNPAKDPANAELKATCSANPNEYNQQSKACKAYLFKVADYKAGVAVLEPFLKEIFIALLRLNLGHAPTPKAPDLPCPAILFGEALKQLTLTYDTTSNGQTVYLFPQYRQPDGNYTAQVFSFPAGTSNPLGTNLGFLPQSQSSFVSCSGITLGTPAPHPNLMADLPGVMSRTGLTTSLGGSSIASITVNGGSNTITVVLDSQATLGSSYKDYPVGPSPSYVVTGDFNGDGKRDLAILGNGSSSPANDQVSILLGNGNGTLNAAKFYGAGAGPVAMTAFDFNKDGRSDLAVVNGNANTVSILLANPDGSMRAPVTYKLLGQQFVAVPSTIVAADFDGDGKTDLMLNAGFYTGFELLRGNGDGTFQAAVQKSGYTAPLSSVYIAAGDFNKDGKIDLASYNSDATVSILLNTGDGSFSSPNTFVVGSPLSSGVYGPGMFVMDFDDDGNPDLVFAAGHPDALLPDPLFVTVLLGKGDGTFLGAAPAYTTGNMPVAMAMADFNGDGQRDIVVAGGSTLSILLGQNGGFRVGTSVQMPSSNNAQWVETADINGDGLADLIAIDSPYNVAGHLYIWLGKGDGTFQTPSTYATGIQPTFLTSGDVNGDGIPDLVISYGNDQATTSPGSSVSLLTGKSGGGFNPAVNVPTGPNTFRIALADVNADGKLDLIAVNVGVADTGYGGAMPSPGNISVSLGNGDGTFKTPVPYTVAVNPISVAIGDVNGDGKPDLIVGAATLTASGIGILLGKGDGTFGAATLVGTYSWPSGVLTADFDGDGKLDIAVVHTAADAPVTVMQGNGDGTFQPESMVFAGDGPIAAIASDFSGKGRADLAVLNQAFTGNGAINLFRNTSAAPSCAFSLGAASQSIAAAGGSGSFKLTTGSGCNWAALSGANWIRVTSGEFGAGTANVAFTVNANTGAARNAAITVGGQTFTITQAGSGSTGSTQPVSVLPGSGTGSPQTFQFTFSDPNGWQDLDVVNILIGRFLDGRNNCYLAYSNSGGVLYLVNDPGTALLPGVVATAGGTTANSQCGVTMTGSSVSGSGNILTLTLSMSFSPAFAGNKVIYTAARDLHGGNSGWQALASWNAPGSSPGGPSVGTVSPGRSSGSGAVTYNFTFNDTNGYQDLGVIDVLINDFLNGNQACYVAYVRSANVLYLVNDPGTALSTALTLNSSGTVGNSQCTISSAGSSAIGSGNSLTLTLNVTFASSFAGNRVVYAAARSNGDVLNSDWQAVATRTVQ